MNSAITPASRQPLRAVRTQPAPPPPASPVTRDDIVFALFRHTKMIAILTVLGIIAAVALYFLYPPTYQSQAKLLVRYVLDRSAVDPIDTTGATASSKSIDAIIGAEVEILTSWDLAVQVADAVGPKRLLPHSSTPPTKAQAAVVVSSGLEVASHKGSNIIYVAYDNRDPELAPLVLNELLSRYFVKHLEVH